MRLAVIGDELVAGTGDSRGLGWVGRVLARSEFTDPPTLMPLPWPGETTRELSARWEGEAAARLSQGGPRGLIIGIGTADVTAGTSSARSRLNLANITDRATTLGIPCFVVGPPPLAGADAQATKELSRSCAEVCLRRGLPFVDLYAPLVAHDQWFEDMAASRARTESGVTLPGQSGYALMAWLVLHSGWYEWTGAAPRE
ncbi:MAG: GDSL-type esterase/lipase family protein [Schaalia hyovaginalis]|nr:GDSL-type esterase/lipase family protein [Schaalia hyovaginalis]MCF2710645.1 lysophospholipase [Schaalia hyovaginalis]MCI6556473.1 GDSL-type esterase/lipase family protein [Schaalia hyovaginalis]MDD7553919.1 GDSL-type esterase/lipase family protein [Schaalia hyovaginalis]MDY3094698.1 GDSL-type esterase/lipase family protein [Schaalia hyovaginalis]MDY3665676.1 GDSL-type esterase/lipase family protein [Schaalia hyovaginalis]